MAARVPGEEGTSNDAYHFPAPDPALRGTAALQGDDRVGRRAVGSNPRHRRRCHRGGISSRGDRQCLLLQAGGIGYRHQLRQVSQHLRRRQRRRRHRSRPHDPQAGLRASHRVGLGVSPGFTRGVAVDDQAVPRDGSAASG